MHLIRHHVLSLIAKGAITAAITAAADFARRNPDQAACFSLIAQAEEAAGYTKAAIQSVSHAIALAPQEPTYRIMRSRLYLKDNRLRNAIADIDCIIALGNARQDADFIRDAIVCRDELLDRLASGAAAGRRQAWISKRGHHHEIDATQLPASDKFLCHAI
jgi:tetratricopeptide (TPR) repeat protein